VSGVLDRVAEIASRLGLSFEKEESVRIHLGEVQVQVAPEDDGAVSVTIAIPLPSEYSRIEDLDTLVKSYRAALEVFLSLESFDEVKYELDTSLPTNPCLYLSKRFTKVEELLRELENGLEKARSLAIEPETEKELEG